MLKPHNINFTTTQPKWYASSTNHKCYRSGPIPKTNRNEWRLALISCAGENQINLGYRFHLRTKFPTAY